MTDTVARARAAQAQWAQTTYEQRREVLRVLLDFVVDNQEGLCRVACRDTGKTSKLWIRTKHFLILSNDDDDDDDDDDQTWDTNRKMK